MALKHSNKIVTDSLKFYMDPSNTKTNRQGTNLLAGSPWSLGTDNNYEGDYAYYKNGETGLNKRVIGLNPFGQQDIIWQSLGNDVTSDADGGWNSSNIPIDNSKLYRFSVWIKRKVLGNGSYYIGTRAVNSTNTQIELEHKPSSTNTKTSNPYFNVASWTSLGANLDEWILFVGHVHPYGTDYLTDAHIDSGAYKQDGTKIKGSIDFIWPEEAVKTVHRSYLYYSTDPTTHQQWYAPRIDVCDGTEPTIKELLNNIHNQKDIISKYKIDNYSAIKDIKNGTYKISSSSGNALETQGLQLNQYNFSIEMVFKTNQIGTEFWLINPNNNGMDQAIKVNSSGNLTVLLAEAADTNQRVISSNKIIETNKFYHIVFQRTSDKVIWYVNGEKTNEVTDSDISGTWGDGGFWSFGKRMNETFIMDGEIGIVKAYNRILTSEEVLQNFNAIRGRYGM